MGKLSGRCVFMYGYEIDRMRMVCSTNQDQRERDIMSVRVYLGILLSMFVFQLAKPKVGMTRERAAPSIAYDRWFRICH